MWRGKFHRWLPYVIDQATVRQLNARFDKKWKATPWPGEEKPAASGDSEYAAARVLNSHSDTIERVRRRRAMRGI